MCTFKCIVIVGGGHGGAALARALEGATDVLLIEPRDCFVHNVAALRAVGSFLTSALEGKTLFIPRYRKDFGNP